MKRILFVLSLVALLSLLLAGCAPAVPAHSSTRKRIKLTLSSAA
jgi:hypothetical protein